MFPTGDLSTGAWAHQQWTDVQLGDQRLNRLSVTLGRRLAAQPAASLPQQLQAQTLLRRAYGLLNHPGVSLEGLTALHRAETLRRAAEQEVVLLVEDTTELDFTGHPAMTGVGPIGNGRGRGLLLHSTLALTPDRQVLGLAHAQVVLRQPRAVPPSKWVRSPEGRVWDVSAQRVGAPPAGVLWVHVSDSGSDIYEYLATCRALDKHFLIRAFRNRRLLCETPEGFSAAEAGLLDLVRRLPPAPHSADTIALPKDAQHPARSAHLVLAWTAVTLAPPAEAPAEIRAAGPLRLWVVRAWEPAPPEGVEPVEWILRSSLPVLTLADAQARVGWYSCRWFCEDFHQCLKTGCRIERSQLDDGADVTRLLGFSLLIAVRLLQLRQSARLAPAGRARESVEPLMLQVLTRLIGGDWRELTSQQFWLALARLGGHQGRRRDGPPGWRTLWQGWHYLADLTEGARLFANANE